jgi:hypothetical protein
VVEGHSWTVVENSQLLGTTRLKHLTTAARLAPKDSPLWCSSVAPVTSRDPYHGSRRSVYF